MKPVFLIIFSKQIYKYKISRQSVH